MGAVLSNECERARSRASLGLDGELSQVEQALLRRHIVRCASCAEFERRLVALTLEIRRAPLQRPARAAMPTAAAAPAGAFSGSARRRRGRDRGRLRQPGRLPHFAARG
jgi:predicted anti-sigma-YlaC factor YlaD